jgi:hypothetical protein
MSSRRRPGPNFSAAKLGPGLRRGDGSPAWLNVLANGYPPDKQEKATQTVLEQAELLSVKWAVA